ncbi:MAG: ornithine cyclodeaminase family protein [Pygmaiobacter massiliensis]|nr:ornithine cyclodeaminase family protein [Pygmaiobacter massiliensis]
MSHEILFLSDKQINSLAADSMPDVIHDVERALTLYAEGECLVPDKAVMRWGTTPEDENVYGRINAMGGYLGGEYNMAGIKWIGSGPMNYKKGLPRASVTVILNDPDTKLPLCISDGTKVSAMRTGAAGGCAVKYLARKDASVMTIIGAGAQSRTQLLAALTVRPSIKTVYINDVFFDRAELFAEEQGKLYPQVKIIPVENPEQACRESDIITTVTLANEPIVHEDWIKKGCLMLNMADFEFTYECVKKASKIVVDTWVGIKHRMISTVALMARDGLIKDEDIHAQLGDVISGKKPGRENDDEIIYFNAVGMGIEDLAVVTRGYRKALEQGIGTKLAYWE